MKGVYLSLVLAVGACGAVVACGGDSSSDGSGGSGGTLTSGGTGGSGGSAAGTGGTSGGSAGTGGAGTGGGGTGGGGTAGGGTGGGGTGGSGGGVECGTENCPSYNIQGFVDIPACCPDGIENQCGVDVSQAEQFIGITGCMQTDAPGDPDTSCPEFEPFTGFAFPGCCLPSGMCGNVVDTTGFGGPNMGCVDTNSFTDAGAPQPCGNGTGGTGGTGAGGSGTGGTGGTQN